MKKLWQRIKPRPRINMRDYTDVTPEVVATLAQHRGFKLLCAIMEDKKARLEATLQQPASLPDGLDAMVQAAVSRAALDARIAELSWIARQVKNAGVFMPEFGDAP